jgi:hypothetical protein
MEDCPGERVDGRVLDMLTIFVFLWLAMVPYALLVPLKLTWYFSFDMKGLSIDEKSSAKIKATTAELQEEREIAHECIAAVAK